ncbi:MAG: hypothetical protein HY201_03890 [Nitrospirae bacterium]|nr:hypothetical protein [Candidatus Troglogloeales bacterium]MBI3598574.1 hypothetical protein [Candidatus Troglogloeales bacterium]
MSRQSKTMRLCLLLLFFVAACSSMSDLSHETYKKGFLKIDPLGKEETAVLQMTGDNSVDLYLPKAREMFNMLLQETLPRVRPLSFVPGADPSFALPSTKKVLEESDFVHLKKATSIRFLLQTNLQQVEVVEGATQVRIEGRLWDIEQGDILWEGVGESRGHLFLFFPTAPASFEKAMEVASRGLIRKLPMRQK